MLHTRADAQTDQLNNGNLYAPRYEEAFFRPNAKNGLGRFDPSALLHYEEAFLPKSHPTVGVAFFY